MWRGSLDYAFVLAIRDDADNFDERSRSAFGAKTFAERILIGPESLGHRFVDYRHFRDILIVSFGESAATVQRDSKRVEVVRSDQVVLHAGRLLAGLDGMAFGVNRFERADNAEGDSESLGHGDDTGERAKARFQFAVKGTALSFLVSNLLDIKRAIEDVTGIEAKINRLRLTETSNEKAGDNEQHKRNGDRADRQRTAHTEAR